MPCSKVTGISTESLLSLASLLLVESSALASSIFKLRLGSLWDLLASSFAPAFDAFPQFVNLLLQECLEVYGLGVQLVALLVDRFSAHRQV